MSNTINGKKLAEKIKDKVVKEVYALGGDRPNLAIILVGDREDSRLYVDMKEREAAKCGIDTHMYRCDVDISEAELLATIDCLNKDDLIDAILVQLPLPKRFDTDKIIKAIDPKKDVDRFHPDNLKILLSSCNHEHVMPPVFGVVLEMLQDIKFDLTDKKVCILANSDIFGNSLAKVLECRGADTCVAKVGDDNWQEKTVEADVLITAVGKKHIVKADMIKKDAVVIDVGITKEGKKVFGDVDFDDVEKKVSYITPVPGGVGPMTIAMLFGNVLTLFKKRR